MWWIVVALLLGGCAVGSEPLVEVPHAAPGASIAGEPRGRDAEAPAWLPACPIERVEVALLPRIERVSAPSQVFKQPQGSGLQAVTLARQRARQEPHSGQYIGGELVYPWVQGQVYTIYLSPGQATGIFLPPGDLLAAGLLLDPEAFDVKTKQVGVGEETFDTVAIRPLQGTGTVETFLLTSGGRRYLLRLVSGKQGMLAVTFTAPRLARPAVVPEEPPLVLPKPRGRDTDVPSAERG